MPTRSWRSIIATMTRYRRAYLPGGTLFFTVALADRSSAALVRHIDLLRRAYAVVQKERPFKTVAICVLPDHLHAIWALPADDADFATRWNIIKAGFSRGLPASESRSASKAARREKGIWQRRYWEHAIRNDRDMAHHVDYIHFNPVKHGIVSRVRDWPHSGFHRYVEKGTLPVDWGGEVGEIAGAFGE